MTTFARLGLNKTLQDNIKALGYKKPTFIQEKSIGAILSGTDTYAIAPTGTGKTAAYLLPILQELSLDDHSDDQVRPIRALFLVPTQELALQVEESIAVYGKNLKLRTISVFGGVRIQSQINRFKRGTDILVATPKRLLDLLKAKAISLDEIKHFVMDEADRLVSMGIFNELKTILSAMPKACQKVLISATDSKALNRFNKEHLVRVKLVKGGSIQPALDKIVHTMYSVQRDNKDEHLFELLRFIDSKRVLIFARTKKDVAHLIKMLNEQSFVATGIHNEISQRSRQARLAGFKAGEFHYLVATDVVSRGIDIDDLYHVVNYDLPVNANDYVHRVGRTARTKTAKLQPKKLMEAKAKMQSQSKKLTEMNFVAGVSDAEENVILKESDIHGHVFSLVSPEQERLLPKIANAVGKPVKVERPIWFIKRK
jgi:ATP-dependent RNA helicase RhlE